MSVVLLHGLGRGTASMYLLERAARADGHRVLRPGYPTMFKGPEELVERWVRPALFRALEADSGPVHVITHSLGGILLRMAAGANPPPWLGRVVMICPPNQGSEIIDFFSRNRVSRIFLGPTGVRLGTGPESLPRSLPPIRFHCGVIAADKCIDPILGALLPRPNDGKVGLYSTSCEGVEASARVHTSHTFAVCHPQVARLALLYIRTGSFG
jgi:triacylglycerol lipase